MLLFPVGFIAPNAPIGTSSKLGLGPTTERLVAAVEAAFAAWSVSKLTLGTAVKRLVAVTRRAAIGIEFAFGSTGIAIAVATERLVAIARRAAVEAALAAWSVTKLALGSAAKRFVAVTRRAAIGIEFAFGSTGIAIAVATERLVAAVEAALAAWSVSKLTLGSAAKWLVAIARRAAVKAALAAGGTIGFFKTGRGGVAVRAISAWAREGKLSAAVGSAFL